MIYKELLQIFSSLFRWWFNRNVHSVADPKLPSMEGYIFRDQLIYTQSVRRVHYYKLKFSCFIFFELPFIVNYITLQLQYIYSYRILHSILGLFSQASFVTFIHKAWSVILNANVNSSSGAFLQKNVTAVIASTIRTSIKSYLSKLSSRVSRIW